MEHENEVHKGFLWLPLSGKLLMKKTWQQKYCYLFKASKFGIERLEVWDNSDKTRGVPLRIITLENCIKITSDSDTHFTVTTKTNPYPYEFSALNVEEKNKWLSAFQSVAFPDDLSLITSIEEDNDLYCSSGEGIFNVKIHPSAASERCSLDNNTLYTLVLTSTAIQLKTTYDGSLLFTWPYCFIRRYGYKSGKFTFEAGRKCDSGEGTFFLEHSNQQEIFRCLASKMKSMKKLLKEDPTNSAPMLDCGDNQFHAALSMEARSRSPLPPSPIATTSLYDVESNISTDSSDKSKLMRQKPMKPPRKSLVAKQDTVKKFPAAYEPVDKYDKIEYRNDAWKTMGVDEVKHTENVGVVDDEDEYFSWGEQKPSNNFIPVQTKAPKIITQTPQYSSSEDNYDKLNFFGSSNKLNVKSGYKQISIASGLNTMASPPSFNDYDEVQPAMEEIRLADDSHLGYALVRKSSGREKKDVDHHFHNNEPYAVISKPKRV
ncbi:docking protein 2 [Asbolus verrucosus]|uniref:Docking protein 2 n=1 Tax=Asbolus verrucosus TaxID=1661398 RepID=A0A482WAF9_ASBVE|nr:docking protein 2 [Asbolus verrucosus]